MRAKLEYQRIIPGKRVGRYICPKSTTLDDLCDICDTTEVEIQNARLTEASWTTAGFQLLHVPTKSPSSMLVLQYYGCGDGLGKRWINVLVVRNHLRIWLPFAWSLFTSVHTIIGQSWEVESFGLGMAMGRSFGQSIAKDSKLWTWWSEQGVKTWIVRVGTERLVCVQVHQSIINCFGHENQHLLR